MAIYCEWFSHSTLGFFGLTIWNFPGAIHQSSGPAHPSSPWRQTRRHHLGSTEEFPPPEFMGKSCSFWPQKTAKMVDQGAAWNPGRTSCAFAIVTWMSQFHRGRPDWFVQWIGLGKQSPRPSKGMFDFDIRKYMEILRLTMVGPPCLPLALPVKLEYSGGWLMRSSVVLGGRADIDFEKSRT